MVSVDFRHQSVCFFSCASSLFPTQVAGVNVSSHMFLPTCFFEHISPQVAHDNAWCIPDAQSALPLAEPEPQKSFSGSIDKLRGMVHGRFSKVSGGKKSFAAKMIRHKHSVKGKPRVGDPPRVLFKRPARGASLKAVTSPTEDAPVKAGDPSDQVSSNGWTVRTLLRHSGPNAGKEYYWYISPDGAARFPSLKKAIAAGFKH